MSTLEAVLLSNWGFSILLGWLVGRAKGRPREGILFALALAFLGVLIVAVMPSRRVRAEPSEPSVVDHADRWTAAEESLAGLKRMLDRGLLTQAEYDAKRATVMRDL